jgi:hypothetical protein
MRLHVSQLKFKNNSGSDLFLKLLFFVFLCKEY